MNGKFISYKSAFATLLNDFPWIIGNYSEEDLLRSVKESIRLVGGPTVYEPKIKILEVKNSMVDIPEDLEFMNSIGATNYQTVEEAEEAICSGKFAMTRMRYNGDEMLRKMYCSLSDFHCKSSAAYILTNGKILPNFGHGIIVVSYLAIITDANGLPMIPDNESWIKAVTYKTLLRVANRMLMTGKMADNNYNRIEADALWYTSQAGVQSKMMSKDERISFKENNLSWPMDVYAESDFFASFNRTKRLD
jgi:hypothetical protein